MGRQLLRHSEMYRTGDRDGHVRDMKMRHIADGMGVNEMKRWTREREGENERLNRLSELPASLQAAIRWLSTAPV